MWGGHRGSRQDLGRSVIEGRDYVKTRSPDVDAGTKVGEGSLSVVDGRGCDGDCLFDTCGGGIDSVLILVSRGDDNRDAGVEELKEE